MCRIFNCAFLFPSAHGRSCGTSKPAVYKAETKDDYNNVKIKTEDQKEEDRESQNVRIILGLNPS